MLHNKPFKKITVTGQTINKEYVLAVHNPKDIDYSGVYALKLKAAGKLFRVDFSIAGDNEISHSDVNIGILNIVDNNSGIGTTQTAFNNNFTLKVVQNTAGLNLIVIRMLTVIMGGSFEMTISNSVPTGLDWSDYGKYIGKDYSTIAGYPFANETVKSPVKILGGINAPEVTTTAATSVTSSGMILNASLTTLGSEASVNVAFDWRLVGAGSWTRTSLVAKTTIGTFSATLSGLASNTTYEYRAVVIGQSNPGNDAIGGVLPQLTVAINIDADSGVNITGTSGGSALNTTNVPSVTNGAVNNATGLMTATADNCVSQTVEIAQQVGQSDFQLLKTTFALAPYQVAIDPVSNTTTLVVTDPESGKFVNNSKFWLESAGVMKLVQAASVAETTTPGPAQTSTVAGTPALVSASNDIVFIANNAGTNTNSTLMGWVNNGSGLTAVNFPNGQGIASYSVIIGDTIIVAANKSITSNVIGWRSTDRGVTWADITVSPGIDIGVNHISNSGNTVIISNMSSAQLFKSTNAGASWTAVITPAIFYKVAGNGVNWVALAANNNVYRSTDSGSTWTSIGASGFVVLGDIAVNPTTNTFAFCGSKNFNPIVGMVSTDNGATWADMTDLRGNSGGSYLSISGSTIIITTGNSTGGANLIRSTNNGTSFSVTPVGGNWGGIRIWSDNSGNWVGCDTAMSVYLKSSNDGVSWTVITPSPAYEAGNYNPVAFAPNGNLYISDRSNPVTSGSNRRVLISGTYNIFKYTCTSLIILHGGAITTTPTLAYKAGQSFESSITATSGTTSYVANTLYSVSRSGNILTLVLNQRAATGRYAKSKATVNKGDVISRYVIDLWN